MTEAEKQLVEEVERINRRLKLLIYALDMVLRRVGPLLKPHEREDFTAILKAAKEKEPPRLKNG